MIRAIEVFRDPALAQAWIAERKAAGQSVGFVPTMGALHGGHLSLVGRARAENDLVVVSIFVNPLQFEDASDLERYPRDLGGDAELLEAAGCDMVFSGGLCGAGGFFGEYESREAIPVEAPGQAALGLEGALRPGHFEGVATIVRRLFEVSQATRAYFGQKDFQQTLVVGDLARRMGGPEVVVCPIGREDSGLARSSRNEFLADDVRAEARVVYEALVRAHGLWTAGERDAGRLRSAVLEVLCGIELEYFELRDPGAWTRDEPTGELAQAVALIVVRAPARDGGIVRLLDNLRLDLALQDGARFVAPVWVEAPAKINPELVVLGKRADGYHEVDLTMLAIDLVDRLRIDWLDDGVVRDRRRLAREVELCVRGPAATADVPLDASNLVVRAAGIAIGNLDATWDAQPVPGKLVIELEKNVPSQAGLGGGSSDAAAALVGTKKLLARLGFAGGAAACDLGAELSALGSDCAFFLGGTGFARCTGRGDEVEELDGRAFEDDLFVLVTPLIECPTGLVYGALDAPDFEASPSEWRLDLDPWHNDLEKQVLGVIDGMRAFHEQLAALESGPWMLSGSGSSFFCRMEGEARAAILLEACRQRFDLRYSGVHRARASAVRLVTIESDFEGDK